MTNDPQSQRLSQSLLSHAPIPRPVLEDLKRITNQANPKCGPVPGGLSHAQVWCIEADSQRWALKCHPKRAPLSPLEPIHRWQRTMHQALGPLVPQLALWPSTLSTCLHHDDTSWELMAWATGSPISQLGLIDNPSLLNLSQRLAELHSHAFTFLTRADIPAGWSERVQRWHNHAPLAIPQIPTLASSPTTLPPLDFSPLQHAVAHHFEQAPSWLRHAKPTRKVTWILRDAWRPHLYFHQQQLSGLIDWSAARIDWPLFDLVRSLNSLLPWNELSRWELAWNTYQQTRHLADHPLDPHEDFSLLRTTAHLSLTLSALYWVDLLSQPLTIPTPTASLRLQELLLQLALVAY